MNKPLGEDEQKPTQTQQTDDFSGSISESRDRNILTIIDTILISVLSVLLIGLLVLIIAHAIDKFRKLRRERKEINFDGQKKKVDYKNEYYEGEEGVELLNQQATDSDDDNTTID
ncbi:uncharacterized protein LOC123265081 [Cotesia glomerata]|nr:uncharacterized protein LOC123265081 [Cotesia glomerata]